ncbi:helix-turn-helix transcriptional regulator [Dyella caseinilytica]|uniref:Helix-turn-helix domain-containing protein n=1 Tax=Dyella caseinilytica TaxID=1849581 RepID=A0ABX7GY97_9GAMM|nr:helix-turn-helix domain-containing protein [Dyella caseinilytica]
MQSIVTPQYVSANEAARILSISRSTWWSWCQLNKAPKAIHLSPGCTRWRYADVLAFAESQAGRAA